MAQYKEQADNHNAEEIIIPPNRWGEDIEIDERLVRDNLLDITKKIAPCKPKIIGVTKYYGRDSIIKGYKAGLRDFGESRAIDAIKKIEALPLEIRKNSQFHFIGHLQTNKADKVVKYFDYIHSVDSLKVAAAISKAACDNSKRVKMLLQVNNAGEEQKFGYTKDSLEQEVPKICSLDGVDVVGLMNMAPLGAVDSVLDALFEDLRIYRDRLQQKYGIELPELSMGMSDDYQTAVKHGATMIRIGRKLFT